MARCNFSGTLRCKCGALIFGHDGTTYDAAPVSSSDSRRPVVRGAVVLALVMETYTIYRPHQCARHLPLSKLRREKR